MHGFCKVGDHYTVDWACVWLHGNSVQSPCVLVWLRPRLNAGSFLWRTTPLQSSSVTCGAGAI